MESYEREKRPSIVDGPTASSSFSPYAGARESVGFALELPVGWMGQHNKNRDNYGTGVHPTDLLVGTSLLARSARIVSEIYTAGRLLYGCPGLDDRAWSVVYTVH